MTVDMKEAARRIERAGETLQRVREEVGRAVVGQRQMVDRLLVGVVTCCWRECRVWPRRWR
jgi:hypothetical protein